MLSYMKGQIIKINALRNLVPFVQFRKSEKPPWRNVLLVKFQTKHFELY